MAVPLKAHKHNTARGHTEGRHGPPSSFPPLFFYSIVLLGIFLSHLSHLVPYLGTLVYISLFHCLLSISSNFLLLVSHSFSRCSHVWYLRTMNIFEIKHNSGKNPNHFQHFHWKMSWNGSFYLYQVSKISKFDDRPRLYLDLLLPWTSIAIVCLTIWSSSLLNRCPYLLSLPSCTWVNISTTLVDPAI